MKFSNIPHALCSTIVAGTTALALTTNVQAQYRPIMEPAYMAPPGAIGAISGRALFDQGGVNHLGGYFVDMHGIQYVRTSPTTIHQVSQPLVFYPKIPTLDGSSLPQVSVPPAQNLVSSYPYSIAPKAPLTQHNWQSVEQRTGETGINTVRPQKSSEKTTNPISYKFNVPSYLDTGSQPGQYTVGSISQPTQIQDGVPVIQNSLLALATNESAVQQARFMREWAQIMSQPNCKKYAYLGLCAEWETPTTAK